MSEPTPRQRWLDAAGPKVCTILQRSSVDPLTWLHSQRAHRFGGSILQVELAVNARGLTGPGSLTASRHATQLRLAWSPLIALTTSVPVQDTLHTDLAARFVDDDFLRQEDGGRVVIDDDNSGNDVQLLDVGRAATRTKIIAWVEETLLPVQGYLGDAFEGYLFDWLGLGAVSWLSGQHGNGTIRRTGDVAAPSNATIDAYWQTGMQDLWTALRAAIGEERVLLANAGQNTLFRGTDIDGVLLEEFDEFADADTFASWGKQMATALAYPGGSILMCRHDLVDGNDQLALDDLEEQQRRARFALGSAQLANCWATRTNINAPVAAYVKAYQFDEQSVDPAGNCYANWGLNAAADFGLGWLGSALTPAENVETETAIAVSGGSVALGCYLVYCHRGMVYVNSTAKDVAVAVKQNSRLLTPPAPNAKEFPWADLYRPTGSLRQFDNLVIPARDAVFLLYEEL